MDTYQERQLDALGDGTRRAILAQLLNGPLAVGQISGHFSVSRPAISQHLRILKEANLVSDTAAGTRRLYAINREGFDSLREYFDRYWTAALSEFKKKVERNNS